MTLFVCITPRLTKCQEKGRFYYFFLPALSYAPLEKEVVSIYLYDIIFYEMNKNTTVVVCCNEVG